MRPWSSSRALCSKRPSGRIFIRRVVWGRLLARAEKRDGETIKPVTIYIREKEGDRP